MTISPRTGAGPAVQAGPELVPAYHRLDDVRSLFAEYVSRLGVDLSFQGYDTELRDLPGTYATPSGRLYLALVDGEPAGCGAFRPYDAARCEMKRLYVRDRFRNMGIGRMLVIRLTDEAKACGYASMLLDTMGSMREAQALYETLGFTPVAPYYDNPFPDVVYLEKRLV